MSLLQLWGSIRGSRRRAPHQGPGTVHNPGFAILVPAGARHNIMNGSSGPMKLYTLYAPPNHRDGVVHATKAEAEADNEHFDGKTTE